MTIVQTLFGALPYIGIHPTFSLAGLSAGTASFIYTVATIVTPLVTAYGFIRKAIVTIHDLVPRPVSLKAVPATVVPNPSTTGFTVPPQQ
jgi:hypothetical protein